MLKGVERHCIRLVKLLVVEVLPGDFELLFEELAKPIELASWRHLTGVGLAELEWRLVA